MTLKIRVGWATRALASGSECGDQVGVVETPAATTVVLVDGLGHGDEAAAVGKMAVAYVRANAELGIADMLKGCHAALARTRGAAVTLLRFDAIEHQVMHAGVGNVELTTVTREPIRPIVIPGIAGARMRKVVETKYRVHPGDLFLLYTDGISSRLELADYRSMEPQALADTILARHAKPRDDAGCVVIRCTA